MRKTGSKGGVGGREGGKEEERVHVYLEDQFCTTFTDCTKRNCTKEHYRALSEEKDSKRD